MNIPTGWKLVPIEPSPAMVEAGYASEFKSVSGHDIGEAGAREIYKAMLDAAPLSQSNGKE